MYILPLQGWVWCLASHSSTPNILMSGGWDATILAWDIASGVSISRVNDGYVLWLYFTIFATSYNLEIFVCTILSLLGWFIMDSILFIHFLLL